MQIITILLSVMLANLPSAHGTEVTATLISDKKVIATGSEIMLGIKLKMQSGWYVYWKNPGETGLATQVIWNLPENIENSPLMWPVPEKKLSDTIVNYGYDQEVILLSKISIPANYKQKILEVSATVKWLACKDICIPGAQNLNLSLPTDKRSLWHFNHKKEIDLALKNVPLSFINPNTVLTSDNEYISLEISKKIAPDLTKVEFFPFDNGLVNQNARVELKQEGRNWLVKIPIIVSDEKDDIFKGGLLVATPRFYDGSKGKKWQINSIVKFSPVIREGDGISSPKLWSAIVFALIGGFILNFMPCVFPIISIKILGFVQEHKISHRSIRLQGILFSSGVLVSFLIIFGIMEGLSKLDFGLGWGYQMQSPIIIGILIFLFFGLALNLMNVYSIGTRLQQISGIIGANPSYGNSFLSGLLATIVATPCTAPLMGAAIGYSVNQPFLISAIIFTMVGIGMSIPYLILSCNPRLLRFLPKAGPWMETLKFFLSFPLHLTVVWLIWILGKQISFDSVVKILFGLVFFGGALYIFGGNQKILITQGRVGVIRRLLTMFSTLIALMMAWSALNAATYGAQLESESWIKWDSKTIINNRDRPVFVDFTAAWCLTCQFNKKTVLDNVLVQKHFKRHNFLLMRADWTNHDPKIDQELRNLGRRGIPVYVIYPPGDRSPIFLPEVLTKNILIKAIDRIGR